MERKPQTNVHAQLLDFAEFTKFRLLSLTAVLLIFGALTRVFNLGVGALVGDEMITFRESPNRLFSPFNPIYYWLVEISRPYIATPEILTRLPSAILSIISIPVFFLVWRNIAGVLASFFGALVLVFWDWHLFHGQYGRFFSGVFLFAMISYFCYWKALEDGSIRFLFGSVAAGVVAFLFHFTAIIALATSALFSGILLLAHYSNRPRFNWSLSPVQLRIAHVHVVLCALGAVAVLPIAVQLYNGWTAQGEYTGGIVWARRFINSFGLVGIGLAALGWLVLLKRSPRLALFVSFSTTVPLALAFFGAQFIRVREDYVFYIAPLLILCAGVLVQQLAVSLSGVLRIGIVVFVVSLLLPSSISHYTDRATLDIREVVAFLEKKVSHDDQVLEYAIEFRHHAQGRLPVATRPGLRWGNQPEWPEILQSFTNEASRTWIVTRTNRRGNPPNIEAWLLANARLVWRKSATRFDYSSRGYEVWLVDRGRRTMTQH